MSGSASDETIRLMLVTDDAYLRACIYRQLEREPSFRVVSDIASGLQSITEAGNVEPDLILMDQVLPDSNGFMMTRVMKKLMPESRVILLIDLPDLRPVALESGASETILTSDPSAGVLETLRRVS